jgi:hypothetical protein
MLSSESLVCRLRQRSYSAAPSRLRGSELLNIAKLVRDHADYYLGSVARSQEEYYTGSGEAPGYWVGHAAGELGLVGRVMEEVCVGCSVARIR